jgi:endonuclease/exonuclease/phosphatase family metal-dependent hydrolase
MTYNVRRCRGWDGKADPDRTLNVIGSAAPDIVALQDIDADHLGFLAKRLGMHSYGRSPSCANALLSYAPLKGDREYDLGDGGCCLLADADVGGKRLHLLNVRLTSFPFRRQNQIAGLLGPELLGKRTLVCPTLVLGDFADLLGGAGDVTLSLALRKAPRLLWNGTYPARVPLLSRDRAYLRGDLRVVDSRILRTSLARQASSHLPLVLTVQVTDPRTFLRVGKMGRNRMEIAPG